MKIPVLGAHLMFWISHSAALSSETGDFSSRFGSVASSAPPKNQPAVYSAARRLSTSESTCEDLGWVSSTRGIASVCGESRVRGSCSTKRSWDSGKSWCESFGARLCTVEDLQRGEPDVTKCGLSTSLVWTSDPCLKGHRAGIGDGDQVVYFCGTEFAKYDTPCCADAVPVPSAAPTAVWDQVDGRSFSFSYGGPRESHDIIHTEAPTLGPSQAPFPEPTLSPTMQPTPAPTLLPKPAPTPMPTLTPTRAPNLLPTLAPMLVPALMPTPAPKLPPAFSSGTCCYWPNDDTACTVGCAGPVASGWCAKTEARCSGCNGKWCDSPLSSKPTSPSATPDPLTTPQPSLFSTLNSFADYSTLMPTSQPSLTSTAGDRVGVAVTMTVVSNAPLTSAQESALRTTLESTVGQGNQVRNFQVTFTLFNRRALTAANPSPQQQRQQWPTHVIGGTSRRLATYSWQVSFDVVAPLSSTSYATPDAYATSITEAMSSNAFESEVQNIVGVTLDTATVAAVVHTRKPSKLRTPLPSPSPSLFSTPLSNPQPTTQPTPLPTIFPPPPSPAVVLAAPVATDDDSGGGGGGISAASAQAVTIGVVLSAAMLFGLMVGGKRCFDQRKGRGVGSGRNSDNGLDGAAAAAAAAAEFNDEPKLQFEGEVEEDEEEEEEKEGEEIEPTIQGSSVRTSSLMRLRVKLSMERQLEISTTCTREKTYLDRDLVNSGGSSGKSDENGSEEGDEENDNDGLEYMVTEDPEGEADLFGILNNLEEFPESPTEAPTQVHNPVMTSNV